MHFSIFIVLIFVVMDKSSENQSSTESNAVKEISGSDDVQKPIESNVKQNARQFDDEEEKVESLCDNPVIHSADRLVNNTIRVYRNHYYWELIGLPSREASVDGPFKIWWNNFGPITKSTCVHTALAGDYKGIHMKYVKNKFWHWNANGSQMAGLKDGTVWPPFPEHGFTAVYHDGNSSGLRIPLIVAFHTIKVYYYDAQGWGSFGSSDGYIGGQFNEKFPGDITSAFSWPSNNPKVMYYVYLFKQHQHCFRPWITTSGKECDEWRDNRELFGCYKNRPKPATQPTPQPGPAPIDPLLPPVEPGKQSSASFLMPQIVIVIIVVLISLIFSFHSQFKFSFI